MQYDIREELELVVTYKEIKNNLYGDKVCFFFVLETEKIVLGQGKTRVIVQLRLWYDSETKKKMSRAAVVGCNCS